MQPANSKFCHTAEVMNSRLPSESHFQEDCHYSGQLEHHSQDCAQAQGGPSNIPDMPRKGKEAERLYAEKQSSGTQRPLKGEYEADGIDGALQQISAVRASLTEQHDFHRAKRTELNEISAGLENVRSLLACFRQSHSWRDDANQTPKKDPDGITAPSRDSEIISDFDGSNPVLARLTTPHNSEKIGANEMGFIATPTKSSASDTPTLSTLQTSYRNQDKFKKKNSAPQCIECHSGNSTSTLNTNLEGSESQTTPLGLTLLPSQQKEDDESWSSSAYVSSSETSAESTTGTMSVSTPEPSCEEDPDTMQNVPGFDVALQLTVETSSDEFVLDPGWDELTDIMAQFKKAKHVPSVQFSSSSRGNWLRGKVAQAKYKKSMARRSGKRSLKSKPARL